LTARLTSSPEAYEYYLRGRDLLFKYTSTSFDDADLDRGDQDVRAGDRARPELCARSRGLGRCYVHHAQGYGGEHYYDWPSAA
jgi:hypothetical protein